MKARSSNVLRKYVVVWWYDNGQTTLKTNYVIVGVQIWKSHPKRNVINMNDLSGWVVHIKQKRISN